MLLKPHQSGLPPHYFASHGTRGQELFFSVNKINTGFPFIIFFNDITFQTKNLAKDFFSFLLLPISALQLSLLSRVPQSGNSKLYSLYFTRYLTILYIYIYHIIFIYILCRIYFQYISKFQLSFSRWKFWWISGTKYWYRTSTSVLQYCLCCTNLLPNYKSISAIIILTMFIFQAWQTFIICWLPHDPLRFPQLVS